jgi:ribosomal-protein-alanine acetyltransferase
MFVSMSLSVRLAVLSDVPSILAIERQTPQASHWTATQYHKLVESGVILIAECHGEHEHRLCGFICAQPIAGEWEIENMAVDARFLRHGIADRLLRGLIQRAESEGASALLLEVRESNLPARKLYEKNQFSQQARRPGYYKDPPEDAILYALRFNH